MLSWTQYVYKIRAKGRIRFIVNRIQLFVAGLQIPSSKERIHSQLKILRRSVQSKYLVSVICDQSVINGNNFFEEELSIPV